MTLDKLKIGGSGVITAVGGQGALRRRLLDMGLTPKTSVMVRKVAPMGDPIELHLRGYELTIRAEDARNIDIEVPGHHGHENGLRGFHHGVKNGAGGQSEGTSPTEEQPRHPGAGHGQHFVEGMKR